MPYDLNLSVSPTPSTGGSLDLTGYSNNLTVVASIVTEHTLQVAPNPVIFQAAVTGTGVDTSVGSDGIDQRGYQIEGFCDFYHSGTDNSYTFTKADRLLSHWQSSRYGKGLECGHMYRAAGSYTARYYAIKEDTKEYGFDDVSVTVLDPDTVFSGTNKIFACNSSANFGDAPYSGMQTVQSSDLDALFTTYIQGQASPKLLILRDGDTFDGIDNGNGYLGAWQSRPHPSFHIEGSYTGATRPVINSVGVGQMTFDDRNGSNTKTVGFRGLDFQGTFDSTTDADSTEWSLIGLENTTHADLYFMDDVVIDGLGGVFDCNNTKAKQRSLFLNDTQAINVAYVGIVSDMSEHAVVGCDFKKPPDAILNNVGQTGWGWRVKCDIMWHSQNDMAPDGGWSLLAPRYAQQPCYRMNYDGATSVLGSKYWIFESFLSAPRNVIEAKESEASTPKPEFILIDSCVLLGGFQSDYLIDCHTGGMMTRNVLGINPNCVQKWGGDFQWFINLQGGSALNTGTPVRDVGSAWINNLDDAENPFGFTGTPIIHKTGEFTTVTSENSYDHQPNITTPQTQHDPLQHVTNTFDWNDNGYIEKSSGFGDETATYTVLIGSGEGDTHEPLTGSNLIGAASSGRVSAFCINSRFLRSQMMDGTGRTTPSQGPFEPALAS